MTTANTLAKKAKHRCRRAVRRMACLGVFIVVGSPWAGVFADYIEPNDTLATACQSGLDGIGFVDIPGAVLGDGDNPALDVDIFSFSITTVTPLPVRLTVSVNGAVGPEPDAYLRLFDSAGN
ncbi:MAG: hypothetical protein IIB57_09305, partial [Planctomycetes bacterium]|nr:hypothetical protein [Planctomycetota bacterium]